MSDSTFIELCIEGKALAQDIDDYVSKWHSTPDITINLNEYLGMTPEEYNAWMLDDEVLPFIIQAHKDHRDFSEIDKNDDIKIAARGLSTEQVKNEIDWLKKHD